MIREMFSKFGCVKLNRFDYLFFMHTTKFGYICVHFPSKKLGWCVYASPDGNAHNSTFYRGYDKAERILAMMRKEYLGHNWMMKIYNKNVPRHESIFIEYKVKELNKNGKELFKEFQLFGF